MSPGLWNNIISSLAKILGQMADLWIILGGNCDRLETQDFSPSALAWFSIFFRENERLDRMTADGGAGFRGDCPHKRSRMLW